MIKAHSLQLMLNVCERKIALLSWWWNFNWWLNFKTFLTDQDLYKKIHTVAVLLGLRLKDIFHWYAHIITFSKSLFRFTKDVAALLRYEKKCHYAQILCYLWSKQPFPLAQTTNMADRNRYRKPDRKSNGQKDKKKKGKSSNQSSTMKLTRPK